MKLAIIQPCFFPYEGYFNMVQQVDKVIFLDDVFLSSKDWVNKTILNVNNKNYYFRIPLKKREGDVLIRDAKYTESGWKKRFIKVLNFNYKFKRGYPKVMPIIRETLDMPTDSMSQIAAYSVFRTAEILNIKPRHSFTFSSAHYDNINTHFVDKILQICKKEKAKEFYALPYLKNTLDPSIFISQGINLKFINANYPKYSILDKMMDMDL